MYLLHRKKIDFYANISLFLSFSEVTVATQSGPYPAQMITAVTRSSPYPDQKITAVNTDPVRIQIRRSLQSTQIQSVSRSEDHCSQHRSSPYPDQMITAVNTDPVRIQIRWSLQSTQIQSVSRSDGGSAPRDDLYCSECQWRRGHLDEPQRQIPSEDLVT